MNPYNIDENPFNVCVTERNYTIIPFCGDDDNMRYRITLQGKYLFTLTINEHGEWVTSKDNSRVDDSIIERLSTLITKRFKGAAHYYRPLFDYESLLLS